MLRGILALVVAVELMVAGAVAIDRVSEDAGAVTPVSTTTSSTTTTTSSTTTTTSSTTTTTSTTIPPTPAASATLTPFTGLGTWIDVFDFSPGYMQEGEVTPVVTPASVDAMAAAGVRTIYIQASRDDERSVGLLEQPELLDQFVTRAHAAGIRVVAWHLPKQYDDGDLERFRAIRDFRASDGSGFDAIGVDIEFRAGVPDVAERNRRLIDLSRRLRDEMGSMPLAAIVLPPVVTDIINLDYWPAFPWREIAPFYDVWMPMSYWTNRRPASEWREARHYTQTNTALVREHLGDPDAAVHPIGGIGDAATAADYQAFVGAAIDDGSVGWSVYDYRTTEPASWGVLSGPSGG